MSACIILKTHCTIKIPVAANDGVKVGAIVVGLKVGMPDGVRVGTLDGMKEG